MKGDNDGHKRGEGKYSKSEITFKPISKAKPATKMDLREASKHVSGTGLSRTIGRGPIKRYDV